MQPRADEWNRIWQRVKAELPRLCQALHACRAEAAKAEHARPPISDGALARAVALLRNKRGIGTDHWTPLELKALPDAATASLAFIVRQTDTRLTIPLQCLTNLTCLLPKPGGGERPIVLRSLLHVLWSSCHADAIRAWDAARARFWDSAVRGCSALQFAIRRRLLQDIGVILGESTASVSWDLQKFHDFIDVRQLLRLGAEFGFPMGVVVVDLQEDTALGRCFCRATPDR